MEPHLTCSAASACTHFLRDPPLSPWDAVGQAGTLTVRPGASRRTSAQLGAGCDRGRAPLSAPPPFTCENGGSACLSGWCGPESHARQGAWQSVPWEPAPLLPTLGPNVTSRGLRSSRGPATVSRCYKGQQHSGGRSAVLPPTLRGSVLQGPQGGASRCPGTNMLCHVLPGHTPFHEALLPPALGWPACQRDPHMPPPPLCWHKSWVPASRPHVGAAPSV